MAAGRTPGAPASRPATVDLNADVGEGAGPGGRDDELLGAVTTAHVACGGHAGDPATMAATVAAAVASGVAVGAHPSYPDRPGFGRRPLDRSPDQVVADVLAQLAALEAVAHRLGAAVVSVKPHGALYHRLGADEECVGALARALAATRPGVPLVLAAGAVTAELVEAEGVAVVAEAFCDRAYRPDGTLADRGQPGAVIEATAAAVDQALGLALRGTVVAVDGSEVAVRAATLCLHGDTPGAAATARAVRQALEAAGMVVAAAGR